MFLPQKHTTVYPAVDPAGPLKDASSGKVVIIAGAGRGIGKAMAHTFAATGARGLVLISRTKGQLEQTGSEIQSAHPACEIKTFALDISQPDAVQEMFKQSVAAFGEVHVLMANAGIMEPFSGTLDEADPSAWWGVCEVNLRGTFNLCQSFIQHRKSLENDSAPGVIIATSDQACTQLFPGYSAHCITKTAINRIIEYAEAENKEVIKAFSINPGGIPTELGLACPERFHPYLTADVTLPAAVSVWLATSDRAYFLSGRYVDCQWDVDELCALEGRIVEDDLLSLRIKET
ncbi:uncharacterized protein N7503_000560 [Penicillium pulvis]|uniref:uncharacterized protein n=1 Tax=Penicillium pulvis TaxID=1562058 RepID=UPI002548D83F|nr:uncharacterized protein N7503_000560 [Penicillium pulvis]KAJ5813810.1 hypothetical protein N7503_000560 [Penicillium pulvis]